MTSAAVLFLTGSHPKTYSGDLYDIFELTYQLQDHRLPAASNDHILI